MAENIQLAARGWQHSRWCDGFYPEDLPADWQLSYYSNEFDAVLVPADYWTRDSLQECIDWCAQVHPEFRFYLEWPTLTDDAERAAFERQLEAMQANLAGVLLPAIAPETAGLQQRLPELVQFQPAQLWSPGQATGLATTDMPLAVLAQPWSNLRELRQWLEDFTAESTTAKRAVLCAMPEPDVLQLQQARTLMQIMGL